MMATSAPVAHGEQLITTLLGRMDDGGGFPALTQAVSQIVEALEAGVDDPAMLAGVVLQDVSLTQKVLRLANSAMYAPIGRDITTVSHALMVLGYEAVGYLALGVRLISTLEAGATISTAEKSLGQSLLAGSVATALTNRIEISNGEEGVVCTLMHRLGQLLTVFYLPDEYLRIEGLVAAGLDEDMAARKVLGIGLEDLGQEVARKWHMPAKIVGAMSSVADPADLELDPRLVALTRFSNQVAQVMAAADGPSLEASLAGLAEQYGETLAIDHDTLLGAVREAVDRATAQPLLASLLADDGAPAPDSPMDVLVRLRRAVEQGSDFDTLVNMGLEALFSENDLLRAALFLRQPAEKSYRVRASLSARAANPLQGLSFSDAFSADVIHVVLNKRADVYIDNPRDTKIAHRLPDWITHHGLFPFFILPMVRDGELAGFLYGQQKDNRAMSEISLIRLKAMRDLLVRGLA